MPKPRVQRLQQRLGGVGDHRAGREDRLGTGFFQRLVVLRRHDAADYDHDITAALFAQLGFQFRHQRQMRGGERGHAQNVHVVLDRLARGFGGGCEQRADVDVETEIGKGGGDDFLAAVVAVLADLGDQDARAAAFVVLELGDEFLHPFDGVRHADLLPVDAGDGFDLRPMPAEHLFERQRYLADGGLGARRVDGERQEIAVAARGVARQRRQRFGDYLWIALALEPRELVDLQLPHGGIVDFENVDLLLALRPVFVDADHRLRAGIDARLRARRG